jgi:hypothetical protein
MIEFWEKGKNPLRETSAIINCPKSGHITPDETNVNTYLEKTPELSFWNKRRTGLSQKQTIYATLYPESKVLV